MRLHRLDISAFGPFAGTETVDFDALAACGLFLFTGQTGAGKTSILDAVCFALYGQLPGARGACRNLRSDHAAADTAPRVVLEVTLRGRRLRVSRSPAWERPKRRGSGTTTEPARCLLEERTGSAWTTLSTRLDETGQLLAGLLGLSIAQFCQVVLLPQGQFADFLRADADKRRDLLQTLFDTVRFTGAERWLVARRQDTARGLDEVDRGLGQVLARVAEAAGGDLPADLDPDGAHDWWAAALDEARREGAVAQVAEAAATDDAEAAAGALRAAEALQDARSREARLQSELADLDVLTPRHAQAGAEIAAARAVVPLLALVNEVDRLEEELAGAHDMALETLRTVSTEASAEVVGRAGPSVSVLAATGTDTGSPGAGVGGAPDPSADGPIARMRLAIATELLAPAPGRDADPRRTGRPGLLPLDAAGWPAPRGLASASRRHRDEVARLEAMAPEEREAEQLVGASDQSQQRIVELDAQARELAELLAAAPSRRAGAEARRDHSAASRAALPGARAACDEATGRLAAADRRDALLAVQVAQADELRAATAAVQAARQQWLDLRQSRLDGMAAELASALSPGVDCPVCGSLDHPRPAAPRPGAVARDQEAAAAAVVEVADATTAGAADRLAATEIALATARGSAGGDVAADALRTEVARLAGEVSRLSAAAGTAEADAAALSVVAQEHESWLRRRVALDQDLLGVRLQVDADRARLARLRAALDDARGADGSIAARARRLASLADDLDALGRQVEAIAQLSGQAAATRDRAECAAGERGIDSLDHVRTTARDEDVLARMETGRQEHAVMVAAVRSRLAEAVATRAVAESEARPADAAGRWDPDLPALRSTVAAAAAARERAATSLSRAGARVESLLRLGNLLRRTLAERVPAAEAHRTADALSRLAEGKHGDNTLRMSLSGYVLAARLEEVAAAASERLSRMSSGRYQLLHSAAAVAGKGRGGLHLRVLDAWTGLERDPTTLSGGETFTASLALALGLADVVVREAGGTLLETLFVDEGFGSLDDDTLDEVMSVLDDLREGGRTVGIVSHVADLRQRIPAQLRVVKGRRGSRVEQ